MNAPSFALLGQHNFRMLLFARMFGMMALQCQAVIVGWQVYSITRDPLMLGLTGLTEAVPAIVCALFAGHFVDTASPHKIYVACMGALTVNTFMLLIAAGGLLTEPGPHILPWIFGGIFVSGLARSFIMPASFSLLPRVVKRSEISAASAWLNSGFQIAAIGGPAVAGLVYGFYGAAAAWLLPMCLMAIGFAAIGALRVEYAPPPRETREPALKSIGAGWAFILRNPVILSVMLLDMFAVLLGGAVSMLPAFADQVLHVGAEGLGILRAATAVGAVLMALVLALRPMKRIRTTTMLWAVAGFGLCMIGFGLSRTLWLAFAFLAVSGALDCISVVIRATIVQLLTPQNMTGRVSSVKSMFIISSNEIGAFESGVAARVFGLVPSIVLGGIATLGVVAATIALCRPMRSTVIDAESDA